MQVTTLLLLADGVVLQSSLLHDLYCTLSVMDLYEICTLDAAR
jgi:hypothetical protein